MFLDKFLLFCIFGSFVIINEREKLVAAQNIKQDDAINRNDIVNLDSGDGYVIEILSGEVIGMLIRNNCKKLLWFIMFTNNVIMTLNVCWILNGLERCGWIYFSEVFKGFASKVF